MKGFRVLSRFVYPSLSYFSFALFRGLANHSLTPPIHEQAASGNLAGVKALVASGVSVNLRNERGWTPLFYALTRRRMDVAQYLVDHGADVNNVDNDGMTLLDQMFCFRYKDQISWLKQHGAHPKYFTENGEVRK